MTYFNPDKPQNWKKLGRIVAPDPKSSWMTTYAGPSHALQNGDSPIFDIYVTGRDQLNRSSIGRVKIDIREPQHLLEVTQEPLFTFGDPGAFDENGVSYPYFVNNDNQLYFFYVGWMPTVLTPFQNHMGLAVQNKDGKFYRVSRAPILERTHEDYLSIGSTCVIADQGQFKMWYTSFLRWGDQQAKEHKHYYVIKYAESKDLIHWKRDNQICINIESKEEYSIGRPSVFKVNGHFHMWYCYRGERYRIGYAHSLNGIHWQRKDHLAGLSVSSDGGWDSRAVCYPHVFQYRQDLYMIYNGNQYGKEGLGLAQLQRESGDEKA